MRLPDRFRQALRYGSGRAFLILREHPELAVDDLLLSGALHNFDYDPQCGGDRAHYIDELLALRPNYRKLLDTIADRFAADRNISDWDASQLYALLLGNRRPTRKMRRVCHRRFAETFPREEFCMHHFFTYEGREGVRFVARTVGERLLNDPEYVFDLSLPSALDGQKFDWDWQKFLRRHAAEPEIAAFLRACARARKTPVPERPPHDLKFISEMLDRGEYCRYYTFELTEAEGETLRQSFRSERDPEKLKILCHGLTRAGRLAPEMVAKLLAILNDTDADEELRRLALEALENLPDRRIRDFAAKKLEQHPKEWMYIGLLTADWQNSDAKFVHALFRRCRSQDIRHTVISALRRRMGGMEPEFIRFLYRHCTCGSCRSDMVNELYERHAIPRELAAELLHESQENIREIARKLLGR